MADDPPPRRRWRLGMRALLLLPVLAVLVLLAIDPFTADRSRWRHAVCEFDVVDAGTGLPIRARVTCLYDGPLAGEAGGSYETLGLPYVDDRDSTSVFGYSVGYGGLVCIVRHRWRTLFFRHHDRTRVEGLRFRVEADGHEPFEFRPVDLWGRPAEYDTWDPPVFRVALRRTGLTAVRPSWWTRPELKIHHR